MRDSGIPWVGAIPTGWEVGRIGGLYRHRNTKVSDADYPPLSVTMQGVVPQLETAAKSDDHENRKLVKVGDFAINSRSDRRGSCGISAYDGSVSLINTVLEPREAMSPAFYNLLFHTSEFADEFYKWGHGIVDDLWTTRWHDMKAMQVPLPALEEQEQIANYLDKRCAAIDEVRQTITAEIETLRRLRKAIIYRAVTKGLDKGAPMRDSGIEWIGEMPIEWSLGRIGGLYKHRNTKVSDVDYQPLSVTMKGVVPQLETAAKSNDHDNRKLVKVGDFAINSRSDRRGSCGISAYEGSVSLINTVLEPRDEMSPGYYNMLFHSAEFSAEFYRWGHGIVDDLWTTRWQDMKSMKVPVPPLSEQQRIADYLNERCATIDSIIDTRTRQLERLEDYRRALIFAYVTGKKEVPSHE